MKDQIHRTLAELLHITDIEIRERKELLEISYKDEQELKRFRSSSVAFVDEVVDEFYQKQTTVPRIRTIIGDSDTLARLRSAMRNYVLTLFQGSYGADYVNSRLRIGKVHARIGVPPKLYVSSMQLLKGIISEKLVQVHQLAEPPRALDKMFLFDLQLVFDTYVQGLVSEVALARDELIHYSESLERIVAERTAQLEQVAQIDELTGLGNRRKFYANATEHLARAESRGCVLGLVFVDLDGFKSINDTQGHLAGDRILEKVGRAISAQAGEDHTAYRYGGDEFCILVPELDAQKLDEVLEAYVAKIESATHERIGVSLGVAVAGPRDYPDMDSFIQSADKAMYDAKLRKTRHDSGDEADGGRPPRFGVVT